MPRNLFAPNCQHVLIRLPVAAWRREPIRAPGAVGVGLVRDDDRMDRGDLGLCARRHHLHVRRQRRRSGDDQKRRARAGSISPIPCRTRRASATPSPPRRAATTRKRPAQSKFANLARFRGFPYVPPPQIVTGPLASYSVARRQGQMTVTRAVQLSLANRSRRSAPPWSPRRKNGSGTPYHGGADILGAGVRLRHAPCARLRRFRACRALRPAPLCARLDDAQRPAKNISALSDDLCRPGGDACPSATWRCFATAIAFQHGGIVTDLDPVTIVHAYFFRNARHRGRPLPE